MDGGHQLPDQHRHQGDPPHLLLLGQGVVGGVVGGGGREVGRGGGEVTHLAQQLCGPGKLVGEHSEGGGEL